MSSIAIVTPILNGSIFLAKSQISKKIDGIKCFRIIADCNSTDGLQNIIKLSDSNDIVYVSQLDNGPAQAINLVLQEIETEFIGWLNSDDVYAEDAIKLVINLFSLNPALKVIYGLSRNIDEEGKYLGYFPTLPPSTSIKKFKDGNFISQPSVFYRRSVFDRVGLLDESLKTAFDFDLFIRIFKVLKRSEIGFINKVLSYSRIHSNTITNKMRREVSLESMKVLYKHFKSAPTHWVITYINELFRDYPFIKNEVSLRQEISNFLIDSKIFFNEKDLIKLIGVLNIDARIKLSDTQYFINVFQDGWAGNELIVKMRYQKGQKSKLKLVCNGGWPSQRILKIKVYSSNGESEVYKVFSRGDFEILLEPTETQSKSFFFWKIKCNDCFIPSKSNVRSSDHRRLAFRVVSAFLE